MQINEVVHGFRLVRQSTVPELKVQTYLFAHEQSGARLFFVQADDDNKVFHITFRTPPHDDTGVAHIVEHSTLCGSRKYPLKEPFVELVKGSLNTFLNAMTYPDKTMYPVASRNAQDFHNLMDVYLDAVFYPAMRENPQVLMQEGWHYELESPEAPLTYSGVVFNEMKGALSDPDDLLASKTMQALYPDTTYHYESGGDPAAIPQLTQADFVAFHSKFYHPSNSFIYLYGDLDIEAQLAYLDEAYLSYFQRIDVDSEIALQAPFSALRERTEYYPVGAEEATTGKTFLSLAWVLGELSALDAAGLDVLLHALLETEAAPMRQALIDAQLGKDVDVHGENDLRQPLFSITINGAEPERAAAFRELVYAQLEKFVREGIDRTLLEASLNSFEFQMREADFGSAPKGLIYGIRIMRTWLYGGEPETYLYYEDILQKLRAGLATDYYQRLLERLLLKNTHAVLLTLAPSTTLAAEQAAKQAEELAARKAAMSEADLQQVMADVAALKERQQSPETPEALATIPVLDLKDIRQEPEKLPLAVSEQAGCQVLWSEVDTQGIAYVQLFFDTQAVPQADLQYLNLLADLLGAVDTQAHSYAELALAQELHTGGISYSPTAITQAGEPDSLRPLLRVRAKAFVRELPALMQLLREILTTSQFTDAKRLRELVEQTQSAPELSLQRTAHRIVSSRIGSYLTPAGAYANLGSLPYFHFLTEGLGDFDTLLAELQRVYAEILPRIFNQHALTVSVTCDQAGYESFCRELPGLVQALSDATFAPETYHWDLVKRNEGFTSSSQVQYVGKGANFLKLGYQFTGAMHVLETLLRYGYFWTRIRVQGGAYGAFTSFNQNGQMYFGSYRDPNLAETLQVFDGTADFISHFDCDAREMAKTIIGTMSGVDVPLTPKMKGEAAASLYLRGISYADRQRTRREILTATPADIRALAPLVAACMAEDAFCVFGNEAQVTAQAALFGSVKPVL